MTAGGKGQPIVVYDPALTRVRTHEPQLDQLVAALRTTASGRGFLQEAVQLGFRIDGKGFVSIILPHGNNNLWRDLEAFIWQVEREQTGFSTRSQNYMQQFSQLSGQVYARTRKLYQDIQAAA